MSESGFRYGLQKNRVGVNGSAGLFFKAAFKKIWNMIQAGFVLWVLAQLTGCAGASGLPPAPRLADGAGHWKSVWSRGSLTNTHKQYLKMQPVLSSDRLYTADAGGKVTALDAASGRVIWVNQTHTPITSGVAVGARRVFVGTGAGDLLALSRSNGRMQWFQSVSSSILAAPVVRGQRVFIKTESSDVYAYRTDQGHIIWNFPVASPSLVLREGGAPAVYGSQLIAGFSNGQIASLSQQSGFPKWRRQLARPQGNTVVARMVDVGVTPRISQSTVYLATYQGKIAAVNAASGRVLWHHPLSSFSGLALSAKAVFITDVSGRIWAFNRTSGTVLWTNRQLRGRGLGAPQVMQGRLFVGDAGGNLYAVRCDNGRIEGMTHMSRLPIIAAPVVYGNLVIAASSGGRVRAYRYTS